MQELYFLMHKLMLEINSLAGYSMKRWILFNVLCNMFIYIYDEYIYIYVNTRGDKVKMCAADAKFYRRAENFWMSHNHI